MRPLVFPSRYDCKDGCNVSVNNRQPTDPLYRPLLQLQVTATSGLYGGVSLIKVGVRLQVKGICCLLSAKRFVQQQEKVELLEINEFSCRPREL